MKNNSLKRLLSGVIFIMFSLPLLAQSTTTNHVVRFKLKSPQLDTLKTIWIYLPTSYLHSKESFPVLYLQDGQNLFDAETSFTGEWRIDETLDSLQLDLIVVGINHGGKKRIDELTPFPNQKYGGGNAQNYLDFITQTLKPTIDKNFRTKTEKENTFIGGSSLGGLFSFYAILKEPGTFGKALVFSPSFWFSEKIFCFVNATPKKDLKHHQLYFRVGKKEGETMVPHIKKMKNLLLSKGMPLENINYESIPDGKHNEASWAIYFPSAALWLLD